MNQTLEDAFRNLVKRSKWYEHSLKSPIQAKNDKARFLNGKNVPEETIRHYLSAAGWICSQSEEWNEPGITMKQAFSELIKKRKWYEHSHYSAYQAKRDKSKFLKGDYLSERRIRDYLLSAGFLCIQVEEWQKL